MTSRSISLVEPKYRHIFPVAPELTFRIPPYAGTTPPSSTLMSMASTGEASYALPPASEKYREVASLWVTLNDIPLPNAYKIVGYTAGKPEWGWDQYEYDPVLNEIIFFTPPPSGQLISVYEIPLGGDCETFQRLAVPTYALLQGAREFPQLELDGEPTPEEPKFPDHVGVNEKEVLTLSKDGPSGQFLGGFSCTLEILSPCVNGLARIGADRLSFEYRPAFGFVGRDSFSYRVVTPFGQQSDAVCVQLYVGV